jgi:hypothetical protein
MHASISFIKKAPFCHSFDNNINNTQILIAALLLTHRTDLIQSILSKLDAPDDLLVDEICPNRVFGRVVPRSKDLLAEEEPPWSVSLTGSLLFGILLTLGDGVHHMVTSTAQGRYLQMINKPLKAGLSD